MWGYPREFLPLLHYIFLQYSLRIAKFLLTKGYELSGKSDAVFLETVYKVIVSLQEECAVLICLFLSATMTLSVIMWDTQIQYFVIIKI